MLARILDSDKALREDTIAYVLELFYKTERKAVIHIVGEIVMAMAAVLPETPAKLRMLVHGNLEKHFVIKTSKNGISTCRGVRRLK